METIETTNETLYKLYSEGHLEQEFSPKQNIKNMVMDRIQKVETDLEGKHFYSLIITKTPTRINYHQFTFEKLQEISRKLTNGLTTLGFVPNRNFWKKYFEGSFRTISISHRDHNEYPSFSLNYIVYSDQDNLDVRIKNNLFTRVKMIDPSLESTFSYLGTYSNSLIMENIIYLTDVNFSSPNIYKLGDNTIQHIFNNQFQRPRFYGKLFNPKIPL
jgi:hypothetical protein